MASTKAQIAKDNGNAAFKSGDYLAAIGFYTSAILEERNDPTYPLNRAAAYLKLGKNEDAERDCTTVLQLNAKNVKAFFRRGQARVGAGKYAEALKDLNEALKIEPTNEAVKQELKRAGDLLQSAPKQRTAPIEVSPPLPVTSTAPKRRRIPITIVEPPSEKVPAESKSKAADDSLLKPVSSQQLTPTSGSSTLQSGSKPKPNTFKEAKQVRENAKPARVGGGIFRAGGSHTIFTPREQNLEPPLVTTPVRQPPPPKDRDSTKAAITLFNFSRAWESLHSVEERWGLFSTIPPSSLPSMFQTSLEASLLVSVLELFASIIKQDENAKDEVREYMSSFGQVPRFSTVLLFMSKAEKELAKEVWQNLGQHGSEGIAAWGL